MNNQPWLFLGSELGLKQSKITAVIEDISHKSGIPFEEIERIKFFASDVDIASISNEIQTSSLFASHRIIVIDQVDTWSAGDAKIIAQALSHKNDSTYVIMTAESNKVSATIEKLIEKSNKRIFWPLSDAEYTEYIIKKSHVLGLSIHPDAIETIIYLSAENTLELDILLSQIMVYVSAVREKERETEGADKTPAQSHEMILKEDIETWLAHYKQETVFKLFEEVVFEKFENAFMTLEFLLRSGEHPSQIMAGLVYQIRNAVQIKQRVGRGERIESVFQSLKIRSYKVKDQYRKCIEVLSQEVLQDIFSMCVDTEENIRAGGDTKYQSIIMNMMLYHFCMYYKNSDYQIPTEKANSYYNGVSSLYLYDW